MGATTWRRRRPVLWAAGAALVLATLPCRARAAEPPAPNVELRLDAAIMTGALAVTALAGLLPVDTDTRWRRELLPFDEPVRGRLSASAARASDVLVALSVSTPLVLQLGSGLDEASGGRALVFGETVAVALAMNAVTKRLVGRPRPYTYSADPRVEAYARREGRDSRLSFYSGHAATAFAAAVGGGYLYAQSSDDVTARAAVWGAGLALAGATAALRVRAGKHFPTDVVVGALVGAGVGWAVPALHTGPGAARPLAPAEWVAIGTAPLAGALLGLLVPMPSDITEPLAARGGSASRAVVVPWVSGQGGGLLLASTF